MHKDVVILIIDKSAEDRATIRSIVESKVDRVLEAADALEGWEVLRGVDHLSMMVELARPFSL